MRKFILLFLIFSVAFGCTSKQPSNIKEVKPLENQCQYDKMDGDLIIFRSLKNKNPEAYFLDSKVPAQAHIYLEGKAKRNGEEVIFQDCTTVKLIECRDRLKCLYYNEKYYNDLKNLVGRKAWLKEPIGYRNNRISAIDLVTVESIDLNINNNSDQVVASSPKITIKNKNNVRKTLDYHSNLFTFNNPVNPEWSEYTLDCIKRGTVFIGMTTEQARLSWGIPKKINRTIDKGIQKEQWIYGDNEHLYFEDGKLVQN